jgi:hypothetical protein
VTVAANGSAVCAADQLPGLGGGTSCLPPQDARDGKMITVAVCEAGTIPGKVRVFGLMPDGVEKVQLKSEKFEIAVPVESNIFETYVDPYRTEVTAIGDTQERHEVTTLPLDGFALAPGETCHPPGSKQN